MNYGYLLFLIRGLFELSCCFWHLTFDPIKTVDIRGFINPQPATSQAVKMSTIIENTELRPDEEVQHFAQSSNIILTSV
jgi:hypothetical protein